MAARRTNSVGILPDAFNRNRRELAEPPRKCAEGFPCFSLTKLGLRPMICNHRMIAVSEEIITFIAWNWKSVPV